MATKSFALHSFRNRKGDVYKQKKDKKTKKKRICIHMRRRSADSSADVAARSLLFEWTANWCGPHQNPSLLLLDVHRQLYSKPALRAFWFSPFAVLSSRKIGSLLYIYTNRGKRFSKEIVLADRGIYGTQRYGPIHS